MGETGKLLASIALAIIGVAITAVVLSKNSNTPSVISATATGFANVIKAAVAPVSGGGSLFGTNGNILSSLIGSGAG